MMEVLTNPVVISVIVLCALCLLKLNVFLSLMIAALAAGAAAGMPIADAMGHLTDGFAANAETSLSYVLLGIFAASIAHTGLADMMTRKISAAIGSRSKKIMLLVIAVIACFSQNVVPVHIAFIPILIPPLLPIMNGMKLDRRGAACALAFGLKAPYIAIPFGFGSIFMGLIAKNMTENGMPTSVSEVARYNWIIALSMIVGLLIAIFISYARPRTYEDADAPAQTESSSRSERVSAAHIVTLLAIAVVVALQFTTGSLPLAALAGLIVMFVLQAVKWGMIETMTDEGFKLMGKIALTMLIAGGYAEVIKSTGSVDALVAAAVDLMSGSKLAAACVITLIGLLVTMGIGSSFSTIPVTAVLYVPLCAKMGFSVPATILLLSAAAALGDAGSPASDTTLGPTCGLNADGKHDHIWDTCVPTFLHFNVPIAAAAIAASVFIL